MSIVIAYKKGDTVYMGTDTRVIVNEHKKNDLCTSNYKIQRLKGRLIVGITADRLTRQTIFAYPEIFAFDKKEELTRKHIVKNIIPKLKEVLTENELIVEKEDDVPRMDGEILLAHKGDLYEICPNFSVYKYETFQAIGPVSDYAQFTLASTNQNEDVNKKIVRALDIVAKNTSLVGAPYLLINTKSKEHKLVRSDNV